MHSTYLPLVRHFTRDRITHPKLILVEQFELVPREEHYLGNMAIPHVFVPLTGSVHYNFITAEITSIGDEDTKFTTELVHGDMLRIAGNVHIPVVTIETPTLAHSYMGAHSEGVDGAIERQEYVMPMNALALMENPNFCITGSKFNRNGDELSGYRGYVSVGAFR